MAVDMFLNLERVNGKSKDETQSVLPRYHPRKMALLSWLAMLSFALLFRASIVSEPSTVNRPDLVRRSAARCAPHPSSMPIS